MEIVSDSKDTQSREGVVTPELVDRSIKLEIVETESVSSDPVWTPRTFSDRTGEHLTRIF